jgi:hypothetical protein
MGKVQALRSSPADGAALSCSSSRACECLFDTVLMSFRPLFMIPRIDVTSLICFPAADIASFSDSSELAADSTILACSNLLAQVSFTADARFGDTRRTRLEFSNLCTFRARLLVSRGFSTLGRVDMLRRLSQGHEEQLVALAQFVVPFWHRDTV